MKTYTFRVTQPLVGYYEGEVSIEGDSEEDARETLNDMSNSEIDDLCENWNQVSEDMMPDGDIEIQQLLNEDVEYQSEDYTLDYKNLSNLSYKEIGEEYVELFFNGKFAEHIEVWSDKEQEEREYIIINSEIIYLDTFKEI
jgi:hypothetical protein